MKFKCTIVMLFVALGLVFSPGVLFAQKITTSHGVALFGDLKYDSDFKHFDYVNPNARKGGLVVSAIPQFDSINNYITLGTPPQFVTTYLVESLFKGCADEVNSAYGLIAETLSYPEDHSWVEFKIRDIAKWNDGKPITPEDVLYSYEMIRDKSAPAWRELVASITQAEITGKDTIKFTYKEGGDISSIYKLSTTLPIFAKHYWGKTDFATPSTEIPVQSSPYNFMKIDVGNTIILKRNRDYWGKDLPVNKGQYNFDILRMDVYRDLNIQYEAFLGANVDVHGESTPSRWKSGYKTEAVEEGVIKRREDVSRGPVMFLGIGMNGRRPALKDAKTREALTLAFDWEWTNKNIFHGMYTRSQSYFSNTDMANTGVPTGKELALLEKYKDQLDPRIFTEQWKAPNTEGSQRGLRNNLRKASNLLKEAGWVQQDGTLHREGKPFTVSFLLQDPTQEATYSPFIENMKRLGIDAKLEIVDATTFWPKVFSYDWDMLSNGLFPHSLYPGTEFRTYWGSEAAENAMSFNQQNIKSPIVDELIEIIVAASDREEKVIASRALDRVLLYGFHSIPLYFWNTNLLAYWDRFEFPETLPEWAAFFPQDCWWIDPAKEASVAEFRGSM